MPQGKERKRGRVRHPTGLRPLKAYTYNRTSGARTKKKLTRIKGTSSWLNRKPSVETSITPAPPTGRGGEVAAVAAVVIPESKVVD